MLLSHQTSIPRTFWDFLEESIHAINPKTINELKEVIVRVLNHLPSLMTGKAITDPRREHGLSAG